MSVGVLFGGTKTMNHHSTCSPGLAAMHTKTLEIPFFVVNVFELKKMAMMINSSTAEVTVIVLEQG
jgi:hypothetical protein